MMYKAKFAVCSEIRKKHLTQSEHHVEIWMLNLVVGRETARLLKVKFYLKSRITAFISYQFPETPGNVK
jgi:hypothetical protein